MDRETWLKKLTDDMVRNLREAQDGENEAVHRPETVKQPLNLPGDLVVPPPVDDDGIQKGS